MGKVFNNNSSADRTIRDIDRKREQERKYMLSQAFRNAEELSTRLTQRLLDRHIIDTTSDRAIREHLADLLRRLSDIDEFDIQYKIAPLRGLVNDPNFISLYLTQYIIEDLIDHPKVRDVYGDDMEIYTTINSVMDSIRPS